MLVGHRSPLPTDRRTRRRRRRRRERREAERGDTRRARRGAICRPFSPTESHNQCLHSQLLHDAARQRRPCSRCQELKSRTQNCQTIGFLTCLSSTTRPYNVTHPFSSRISGDFLVLIVLIPISHEPISLSQNPSLFHPRHKLNPFAPRILSNTLICYPPE